MLRLFTERYIKEFITCVNTSAIRKIASSQDNRLKINVHSRSAVMDVIDCHNALVGCLIWMVPIFLGCRMSITTAIVPQLRLCHLHWLMSIQSVGDLYDACRKCYISCLKETLLNH